MKFTIPPSKKKENRHPFILPHVLPHVISVFCSVCDWFLPTAFTHFIWLRRQSAFWPIPASSLLTCCVRDIFQPLLLGVTLRWLDFSFPLSVLPELEVSKVLKFRGRSWCLPFFLPLPLLSKARGCPQVRVGGGAGSLPDFFFLVVVPSCSTLLWGCVILESKTSWHVPPRLPGSSLLFIAGWFSESCPFAFSCLFLTAV